MTIRFHSSVIVTRNVRVLARFYQDVLEQEVTSDFGAYVVLSGGLSIWCPAADHVAGEYLSQKPNQNGNMERRFETDDFEGATERLNGHQINTLHTVIQEIWGQRTVRFFDPDGNLVEVGESIPWFVIRLHAEGLSLEDVAKKTSVPLESVRKFCKEEK
ncbi:MAG: VOC family protein [Deltaproteobacteria bacterium]|nr:VOC family protein [Deltaproteobacteria bacterium]